MIITLKWHQSKHALRVAGARMIQSRQEGQPDIYGVPPKEVDGHTAVLALAEAAVATELGVYYCLSHCMNIGDTKARDVGPLQVGVSLDNCSIIVHDSDKDDQIVIGAYVLPPDPTAKPDYFRVDLYGWNFIGELKRPEFEHDLHNGRVAYFAPCRSLRPMDELIEMVKNGEVKWW